MLYVYRKETYFKFRGGFRNLYILFAGSDIESFDGVGGNQIPTENWYNLLSHSPPRIEYGSHDASRVRKILRFRKTPHSCTNIST